MVDTDDVQGYRTKYDNQMDLLADADIDDADRDTIRRWVIHLRTNDMDIDSLGTVVGHLNRIRLAAERAHMPLTEMDSVEDVNAFKLHLEDAHGLSEGTIRNYMKAVRKFCQYRDVEWADEVSIGSPPQRKHDPDDNISSEELEAMFDAANDFDSAARDKALIALLRDTGLRIGAVLSFRIKDVNFDSQRGTIAINTDGNVKDADGPKPVTWSRSYVSNWLDIHPRPDDPDAALIHKTRQWDEDEDGALRQQYAGRRIAEIAEAAGLDADRIHAHLFRGTAISEWIIEQMGEQTIKHRADWSEDSRMFEVYSRVSDEQMNDVVFDHYDIEGESSIQSDFGHGLDTCPHCKAPLRGGEQYCPSCAGPLSQSAVETTEEAQDRVADDMVELEDVDKRAFAREALDMMRRDADFMERLAARLDGDHSGSSP